MTNKLTPEIMQSMVDSLHEAIDKWINEIINAAMPPLNGTKHCNERLATRANLDIGSDDKLVPPT